MKKIIIVFIVSASLQNIFAQQFSKAIEDNSFYIEEAYDQESHVVQHIFTGYIPPGSDKTVQLSFTQEWPAFGREHQLSASFPYTSNLYGKNGIGDILINYRYQLIDGEDVALSPRLSLILPTGDDKNGFGNGVAGMQINIPLSHRWNNDFISHYNVGGSVLPNAKLYNAAGRKTITSYFAGTSFIYLTNARFNVMVEILFTSTGTAGYPRTNETILSPGFRYAIDIGDLQIVPGIAFPQTFRDHGENIESILFYLSFEHPY